MTQQILEFISDDEYQRIEAEREGQQQLFAEVYHELDLPEQLRRQSAHV